MEIFVICIIYIGILLYLANLQDLTRQPSPWVTLMMMGLPLQMLYLGIAAAMFVTNTVIALGFGLLSALIAALGFGVIHSAQVRQVIVRLTTGHMFQHVESSKTTEEEKVKDVHQLDSAVHIVALLLALFLLMYNFSSFVIAGGTAGVAKTFDTETPALILALTNGVLNLFVALLGVGLFIRRNEYQMLARLGLRWPTRSDLMVGLVSAVVLVLVVFGMTSLLSAITPSEVLEQQYAAVEMINAPLAASLLIALLSAIIYGTSEEILYRGAIQPIFGLVPTAILFTLTHLQYLFTPAMLIIFIVGIALGLLRQRLSTTAAIVAHIVYNVLPFIVMLLLGGNA